MSELQLDGYSAGYPGYESPQVQLDLVGGQIGALIGRNGSGKTTVIQGIAGVLLRETGTVRLDGVDIAGSSMRHRRERGIVYVPQGFCLFQSIRTGRLEEWGEYTDLAPTLSRDRYAMSLSGGEQRKLALSLILRMESKVLLLDEPFAGLDMNSKHTLRGDLSAISRSGNTVILLTAHSPLEVRAFADTVFSLF